MHPLRARALAQLTEAARIQDETLGEALRVLRAPRQYGVTAWLATAFMMVPLTSIGAVLIDFNHAMVSRITDEIWARVPPASLPEE
jgi:hypothetical protein